MIDIKKQLTMTNLESIKKVYKWELQVKGAKFREQDNMVMVDASEGNAFGAREAYLTINSVVRGKRVVDGQILLGFEDGWAVVKFVPKEEVKK